MADELKINPFGQITLEEFEKALELAGFSQAKMLSIDGLPVQVKDLARALAPLAVYKGDVAMARLDWVDLDERADTE